MATDKKVKVNLSSAITYGGSSYPIGIQELPEKAAKAVKKKKLGTIVGEELEEDSDFTPLSIEETMERMNRFDFSDEVTRSLQFHQSELSERFKEKVGGGGSEGGNANTYGEYPDDFPMAQVLHNLGVKFADVQKLNRDELIALKGIGEKSADAILAYGK